MGPVKTALLDIPLGLDRDGQRMVSKSDGIELLEFNERGYLTARKLGQWRNGEPSVYPREVYILDERDRVQRLDRDTIKGGGPGFRVWYEYSVVGNTIEVRARKVEILGGRGGAYRTYRQEFEKGTRKLLVFVHTTTSPAPLLERLDVLDGARLLTSTLYSGGEPLHESRYSDGKLVARPRVSTSPIREERWTYGTSSVWPTTEAVIREDGQNEHYAYEYILDDRGNWTTKRKFLVKDGGRQLIGEESRKIAYH